MISPTTKELMSRVDSTYTLCNVVGKRARQLVDGVHPLTQSKSTKPVSIAAKEIGEGKVTYTRIESAPKKERNKEECIFESCR